MSDSIGDWYDRNIEASNAADLIAKQEKFKIYNEEEQRNKLKSFFLQGDAVMWVAIYFR